MGVLCVQSHDQSTSRGQSTLNRIQTTSQSGLSQTGFKPLWLNAHSRLDSVNANQCALNRIECTLSVQCERALGIFYFGVATNNACMTCYSSQHSNSSTVSRFNFAQRLADTEDFSITLCSLNKNILYYARLARL